MRLHIVTNVTTLPYFRYCVTNHRSLAVEPEKLEFVPHCLDGNSWVELKQEGYDAKRAMDGSGSQGHALGLRSMLVNLSNDVNIAVDSDSVVLMRGWDLETRRLLATWDCVGTTYEKVGGFSSGSGLLQTFKDLPNFTWTALSPRCRWQFDTMSDKMNPLPIDTQELSETFNLPVGYSLLREVIWQFPIHLRNHGLRALPLNFVRPTSGEAKAILSGEDYHTEYQLPDGTPFVGHQRGSMSKAFRSHPLSAKFYDAVERYVTKL